WLTDLNVIGQFKNTFILAENDKDLFIIDQHVVHERILYEKFIKEVNDNKVTKAPLLAPIPIYLDPQEESILIKNIIVLNDLGFEIENFGPQTYLIRTLPSTLEIENPEEFFTDLLEDLEKSINNSPAKIRDSVITIASCKGAVKANDKLSMEKIKYLLNELSKTENPNTCPHGRPIFKKISINELYRYFQRGGYND
ncbi:MAG: DNA mismatch repair protein MutL, partial [Clostridia bacterium]|nr:DNA mismatch repair protein MutL [Clostridia bacterium]